MAALSVVIAVIAAFRETRMRKLGHERRMHAFRESTGKRSRANLHPEPPEPSKHRVALEVRDFVCKPLRLDSDFAEHSARRDAETAEI